LRASKSNSWTRLLGLVLLLALAPAGGAIGQTGDPLADLADVAPETATAPLATEVGDALGVAAAEEETDPLPPLTRRADGHRSAVEAAWFAGGSDPTQRAQEARFRALQLGARSYEAAARALLAAGGEGGVRLERLMLAERLAPDLPLVHMELARVHLDEGEYPDALAQGIAGLRAIPANLEASAWLAASLLAMFAAVLTLGSIAFIVWLGTGVFRHAAHDFGDLFSRRMPGFARGALLASAMLVPVLLGEGLMGVVVGLFLLGFLYRRAGYRRALFLSAVLLVVGVHPMTRFAGMALGALDSDPVAASAHAVVRGMTSPTDIERLVRASGDDVLAKAALAVYERRSGSRDTAMLRYQRLLEETPNDPVVLANLANMHFEQSEYDQAIRLGEEAANLVRSATLLFNLSQVYARSFRMDEFEGAMAQAQLVDASEAADLARAAQPGFVADLAFPVAPIRNRMLRAAQGGHFVDPVSRTLAPGRLGESWTNLAGAFFATALLGLLAGGRWEHSSCCQRCGKRVCNRCDGSVWNSQICDGCHHLFNRPETTDPTMRMARLSALRRREARLDRLGTLASLLLPGVGGLLARRPDLSFLGLFFFAWAAFLIVWRDGIVPDPLAVGSAGPLVFATAAGLAVLGYAGVVYLGLAVRRSL